MRSPRQSNFDDAFPVLKGFSAVIDLKDRFSFKSFYSTMHVIYITETKQRYSNEDFIDKSLGFDCDSR